MATDFRWAVRLSGENFDLDDACTLFRSAAHGFCISRIQGLNTPFVAMQSEEFEKLNSSSEVWSISQLYVDRVSGLLYLRDQNRSVLKPSAVHEFKDGRWSGGHVYVGAHFVGSSRMRVRLASRETSNEEIWFAAASQDDAVAEVLNFLRAEPDWFDLYKAFEVMRDDIHRRTGGQRYEIVGWPKKATIGHFTQSAQFFRHSSTKWPTELTLASAMKLEGARKFVGTLATQWLKWRYSRR